MGKLDRGDHRGGRGHRPHDLPVVLLPFGLVGQHLLLASESGFGAPDGCCRFRLCLGYVFDGDAVFFGRTFSIAVRPLGRLRSVKDAFGDRPRHACGVEQRL